MWNMNYIAKKSHFRWNSVTDLIKIKCIEDRKRVFFLNQNDTFNWSTSCSDLFGIVSMSLASWNSCLVEKDVKKCYPSKLISPGNLSEFTVTSEMILNIFTVSVQDSGWCENKPNNNNNNNNN